MPIISKTFATLLYMHRKSLGWTQEELAAHWNYSKETVSAWERGKRSPSIRDIPRLAHLFEMNQEELAQYIKPKNPDASLLEAKQKWEDTSDVWEELQHIYRTRTEFNSDFSYIRLFENAQSILVTGISLNAVALTYSRNDLIQAIVDNNCTIQLCFLDPSGKRCKEREEEENYPPGTLANLTNVNILLMRKLHNQIEKISPEHAKNLEIRIYDLIPRFNIYIVDNLWMTVQSYGYGRGEDTPTLLFKRKTKGGLFDFYTSVAKHIFEQSTDANEIIGV